MEGIRVLALAEEREEEDRGLDSESDLTFFVLIVDVGIVRVEEGVFDSIADPPFFFSSSGFVFVSGTSFGASPSSDCTKTCLLDCAKIPSLLFVICSFELEGPIG